MNFNSNLGNFVKQKYKEKQKFDNFQTVKKFVPLTKPLCNRRYRRKTKQTKQVQIHIVAETAHKLSVLKHTFLSSFGI